MPLATLAFWHEANVRPRCHREHQRLLFDAEEPVWIPEVTRREMDPFYPLRRGGHDLEILRYEDRLWWPLRLMHYGLDRVTFANLASLLQQRSADLLGITPRDPQAFAAQHLEIGIGAMRVVDRSREIALLAANRKIRDNLLIVDGDTYVRGGPPVRILSDYTGDTLIDPGPSRFLDRRDGLKFHPSFDLNAVIPRALRRGHFAILGNVAGLFDIDFSALDANGVTDPFIAALRVDACSRNLSDLLVACETPVASDANQAFLEDFRSMAREVCSAAFVEPWVDSLTTTYQRLIRLRRFTAFTERYQTYLGNRDLVADIGRTTQDLVEYCDDHWEPADDNALEAFCS